MGSLEVGGAFEEGPGCEEGGGGPEEEAGGAPLVEVEPEALLDPADANGSGGTY